MYVSSEPFRAPENPAFVARKPFRRATSEEVLFQRLMRAVELVARQELPMEPAFVVRQDSTLTVDVVTELMSTEKFLVACRDRGIEVSGKPGLSAQQLAALAIYCDMTKPLTHAQKLRAAGVTEMMWRGWLRQTPFRDELAFLSSANLKAAVQVGEQRLAEHVDAGNMQAIEFVFAMEGRFRKDAPPVDVRKMLLEIFNVLDEEGVAVETLSRISDKIKVMLGEPVVMQATVVEPQPLEQGVAS